METPEWREMRRLLAQAAVIQSACDLDLLVFLYRHPRALLTSEQLAVFVGYPLKDIAKALNTLIEAGLLGRMAQHSGHAARMFLLLLDGPQGGGVKTLLELASRRQGRQGILEAMDGRTSGQNQSSAAPSLKLVKWA
ncbi:MAG TPA: hypothetical protein VLE46_16690 [Nitrospira sp.]|nr:hypothetical protein [Nitrospira sp.]